MIRDVTTTVQGREESEKADTDHIFANNWFPLVPGRWFTYCIAREWSNGGVGEVKRCVSAAQVR